MLYIVATGFLLAARLFISPSFGEGGFASSPPFPLEKTQQRRKPLFMRVPSRF